MNPSSQLSLFLSFVMSESREHSDLRAGKTHGGVKTRNESLWEESEVEAQGSSVSRDDLWDETASADDRRRFKAPFEPGGLWIQSKTIRDKLPIMKKMPTTRKMVACR